MPLEKALSPAWCRRRLRRLAAARSTRASTPSRSATSAAAVSRSFSTPKGNRCGSASRRSRTVSPNQREAEHVVGQELEDEEDF